MRIVVVDGHTLNPGDLSWKQVEALGALTVHARTAPSELLGRCANAEAALTNKVPFSRATLEALPNLRYIGVTATGFNIIDVQAARERGVVVTNVPEYGTMSVAQHTFALILELTNRAGHHAASVASGRWSNQPDFCYWDYPLMELHGKTLGIIGFGRIGQAVGQLGKAFGMRVLAAARRPIAPELNWAEGAPVDEVIAKSDVVSLHCPLTDQTKGLINAERLRLFKPGAFLVNTSRGPLIVDADLAEALNTGRIAGAALDVLSVEPPPLDNPLLKAKNCLVTPHQAWATFAARSRLMDMAVENLRAWKAGKPVNVVS